MNINKKILVLGSGNFGTCLAQHLANYKHEVIIWGRSPRIINSINRDHTNPKYLSQFKLHPKITATLSFEQIHLSSLEAIVLAIPTQFLRECLLQLRPFLTHKTLLISAAKGIENETTLFPSEIITSVLGNEWGDYSATLSGPSFAIEIMEKQPTCVSIASINSDSAIKAQLIFHTPLFRAYTSDDPKGLEIAGALKNVIAIASGAASGLGYQANSQAALITRGLAEITRFGKRVGADPITFTGLGGAGDLFLTCMSTKSRNYAVGSRLAKGETLKEITSTMGSVAEGVATALSAYNLSSRLQVDTPIISEVYKVLYKKKPVTSALKDLVSRDPKDEIDPAIKNHFGSN